MSEVNAVSSFPVACPACSKRWFIRSPSKHGYGRKLCFDYYGKKNIQRVIECAGSLAVFVDQKGDGSV